MTFSSLIRRTVLQWQSWRLDKTIKRGRKAMDRAIPELAALNRQYAEYRRQHRRGSARIVKMRRDAVTSALAGRRGA